MSVRLIALIALLCVSTVFAGSATCSLWGDPHYSTFDGHAYTYMNSGSTYLVVAPDFAVWVDTVLCGFWWLPLPTCAYAATVYYQGQAIQLTNTGNIYVAAQVSASFSFSGAADVGFNNWGVKGGANLGFSASVSASLNISVSNWNSGVTGNWALGYQFKIGNVATVWIQGWTVIVTLDDSYQGKVGGLCGNYDGNSNNDFYGSDCVNYGNWFINPPSSWGNTWVRNANDNMTTVLNYWNKCQPATTAPTAGPTSTPAPVSPTSTPAPGSPTSTPAPGTPAPGTPAPGTPAPGTPAPGTPAPGTPAPGTPAPGTPAPGTPSQAPTGCNPGFNNTKQASFATQACLNAGFINGTDLLCECETTFTQDTGANYAGNITSTIYFYCAGLAGNFSDADWQSTVLRQCKYALGDDNTGFEYCACVYDFNLSKNSSFVTSSAVVAYMTCNQGGGSNCYNASTCADSCNYNGKCVNGACKCADGYSGATCGNKELLNKTAKIAVITAGVLAAIIIGAVAFVAISGYGGFKGYQYMKEHRVSGSHSNPLYNERPQNSNPLYNDKK